MRDVTVKLSPLLQKGWSDPVPLLQTLLWKGSGTVVCKNYPRSFEDPLLASSKTFGSSWRSLLKVEEEKKDEGGRREENTIKNRDREEKKNRRKQRRRQSSGNEEQDLRWREHRRIRWGRLLVERFFYSGTISGTDCPNAILVCFLSRTVYGHLCLG